MEGFVVCELNHRGLWGEERLVYVDLGIDVDRVVTDVEELNDFGLLILLDYTFAGSLFLY